MNKTVRVAAAVIIENGHVFAAQRGYGDQKGGWEFPGGKIESGETPEEALRREIREELNTQIRVNEKIDTIEYDYETFHLSMDCFRCEVIHGNLELLEAEDAGWLTVDTLYEVNWLPADRCILPEIASLLKKSELGVL